MNENIKCPYCLNETKFEDTVYDGEEIEWECPDCEKCSVHTASVDITFTTERDCGANNEEHAFVARTESGSPGLIFYACKKCDSRGVDTNENPDEYFRDQVVEGQTN